MRYFSWTCQQTDDHVVYALTESGLTKDCPICSQPVEPYDDIDKAEILRILAVSSEAMNQGGPTVYFYNITQTVLFHSIYGIKTCIPGNEVGMPGQVPGWNL